MMNNDFSLFDFVRFFARRSCVLALLLLFPLAATLAQSKPIHRQVDLDRVTSESPQVLPVEINGERFEMVRVQGGFYMMGCDPMFMDNVGRNDEVPQHAVSVNNFYLARFEVTQRLWKAVMGYNPSNFFGDENPVEQVSYDDVMKFIEKLNLITGRKFRLPTEAEWEFAARGGMLSEGFAYSGSNNVEDVAWMNSNCEWSTHPVGELTANELGLYDMTGNVWEWCSDWYDVYNYFFDVVQTLDPPEGATTYKGVNQWLKWTGIEIGNSWTLTEIPDPHGLDTGEYRVGRGGSWADRTGGENALRVSYRNFWPPDKAISILGFRLALSEEEVSQNKWWMPNQYVVDSSDGKLVAFSAESIIRSSLGVLDGLFSVSDSKRVRFSRGNLQYNAVRDEWRFATYQYDIIGEDNTRYSHKYAGWIDLFAWGTSGHHNRPPYFFAAVNTAYGHGERNIDGTHYDWGLHNPISNGGAQPGLWRTLSVNEWAYLLMRRPDAYYLSYTASIDNHKGLVLLPDNWLRDGGDTVNPDETHQYTIETWRQIERAGAVFLPCAGYQKFNAYYYGVPIKGIPQIETVTTGFGVLVPRTLESAQQMANFVNPDARTANNNAVTNEPMPEYTQARHSVEAMAFSNSDREFDSKSSYRPSYEEGALGYYWTTVHYEKNYAMGFGFNFGSRGFLLPFERLTRLSVRLVQDE